MISLLFVFFTFALGLLPIPERALPVCQNCSTLGYDVVPLGEGIWALTDGGYWSLAIHNQEVKPNKKNYRFRGEHLQNKIAPPKKTRSITLVDAWEGPAFLKAVNTVLALTGADTVKYLVYSHQHTDHIGSAYIVKDNWPTVKIVGQEETRKTLKRVADDRRPAPDKAFTDGLDLPEAGLQLRFIGPAHSLGDIAIYHPASKTLMFVDVVFPRWVPFWNYAISIDIPAFYDAHEKLLAFDFETFVGGHLTRLGDRADVEESYEYIKDLKETALRIMPTLNFGEVGGELGAFDPSNNAYGNLWEVFRVMLDDGAKRCQEEIEGRWGGVIGGVDVWTYSHCWAIIEALRVDFALD